MVNTRSEIRAITQGHKRARYANDAIRDSPIMILPEEIRYMIYTFLAPVDRLKIDSSDALAAAFNARKEYHVILGQDIVNEIIISMYIDLGLLSALRNNPLFDKQYVDMCKDRRKHGVLMMLPDRKCRYCGAAPHEIITSKYISFWTPRYIEVTDEYLFGIKLSLNWLRHISCTIKCISIKYTICRIYRLLVNNIVYYASQINSLNDTHIKYLDIFEEYYINKPIIPLVNIIKFHSGMWINKNIMIIELPNTNCHTTLNYNSICKLFSHFVPYITELDEIDTGRYDIAILNMIYNPENILRLIREDKLRDCNRANLIYKIKLVNTAILRNRDIRRYLYV